MNFDITFISKNNTLDKSALISELKQKLTFEIESMSADDNSLTKLNHFLSGYFKKKCEQLNEINCSALIPEVLKIIMDVAVSFGIKQINLSVEEIFEMINLLNSNTKSSRKGKKKRDKRSAVLEAAMSVFSKQGFHETHVADIAELAGVAKGTVYRYFVSKEEILKELIKCNSERLVKDLSLIFNKDGHMLELIKEGIECYINFFESNKDLYKILTHAPWILNDISDHFYKNIISHLQVVRRGVFDLTREGIVKHTDFYTVFYGIFGFIDGVMQKWFRRNCEYSLKDELPVIIEVLFYGFVGEQHKKEKFV